MMIHSFSTDTTIKSPEQPLETRHAYAIYLSDFLPGGNSFTVWTMHVVNSYTNVNGIFESKDFMSEESYSEHFTDYREAKSAFDHQCLRAVSAIMAGIVPLSTSLMEA